MTEESKNITVKELTESYYLLNSEKRLEEIYKILEKLEPVKTQLEYILKNYKIFLLIKGLSRRQI